MQRWQMRWKQNPHFCMASAEQWGVVSGMSGVECHGMGCLLWNGDSWGAVEWSVMGWGGMGRGVMGKSVMGCHGMEWYGMGWHGLA